MKSIFFPLLQINILEQEKYELQQLRNFYVDKLKQEEKEKKDRQSRKISSEIYRKRQQLDFTNKEIGNIQVKISHCNDLSAEVILMINELENCIKGIT